MLTAVDDLPTPPRRVLVAGTSGSGKTTLARRVSATLGLPHVEIDALFHGPDWVPRPTFVNDVAAFTSKPRWVTEWQYHQVRALLADRADLLVWLDLPRATVMRQVVRRTLRRSLRREVLWNGNVEPPLRTIVGNTDHIIRWAWRTHHQTATRVGALLEHRPELPVVHLRSHDEAERWGRGPLVSGRDGPAPGAP